MQHRTYDAATAKAILDLAFSGWELLPYVNREEGIFQSDAHREVSPSGEVFDWTPAYDMDGPDSPNPISAPMLPIPFSPAQLAVFMLDGAGAMIPEALECRIGEGEPNFTRLQGPRLRVVREALREAFRLASEARQRVGAFDHEKQALAHDLCNRYDQLEGLANEREKVFEPGLTEDEYLIRRFRAVASTAGIERESRGALATTKREWEEWRRAMVREILNNPARNHIRSSNQKPIHGTVPADSTRKRGRSDLLTPVIEAAQMACGDPNDTAKVWSELRSMAERKVQPLRGITEEGIQWVDSSDAPKTLKIGALRDRIRRASTR